MIPVFRIIKWGDFHLFSIVTYDFARDSNVLCTVLCVFVRHVNLKAVLVPTQWSLEAKSWMAHASIRYFFV